MVAVNNKDIRRRERGEARIERSLELLPAVRRSGAECAVSAGGIADERVAARLLDAGYDALLIGTALLRGMPRTASIEEGEVVSRRCVAPSSVALLGSGSRCLEQGHRQLRSRTKDSPVRSGHP